MPCSPNPIDWRKAVLAAHVFLNTASVVLDATVLGGAISWVPDVLDGVVSVAEGDLTGALISAGAAIPYIGSIGNAAKVARVGARYADEIASAAKTCCFVAGTLVMTSSGLRPIEQIAIGDQVLSRDEATGETAFKPVTELIRRHDREIWELELEVAGAGDPSKLAVFETTDDHPWRTVDGRWLQTMELQPGMEIQRADGRPARIISVVKTERTASTYNLEVADFHTYFVGEAKVWVHNTCKAPDPAAAPSGKSETGSYTNTHASGKTYDGKGDRARSQESGRRVERETGDQHTATDWTPADNSRDAFKQESGRLESHGGAQSPNNYNKIESPGKRMRIEDEI